MSVYFDRDSREIDLATYLRYQEDSAYCEVASSPHPKGHVLTTWTGTPGRLFATDVYGGVCEGLVLYSHDEYRAGITHDMVKTIVAQSS